ncbi:hypothetical protein SAV31267_022280 [Streptomyces avermitilis]|uniref:Uncharacterized protein n=1 Tax=Streptomyces avermitilis TaxID=33903 RepID=A0A4D4MKY3_STRAX|nr:hypothetical protein SAV31267_022280 [Streptomyces avermitilis]
MRLAKGRSYDGGIPGRGFRAAGRGTARRGTAEGGSCGTGGTAPSVSREVACPSREAGPVGGGVVGRGGTAGRGGMEARRASVLMHPRFVVAGPPRGLPGAFDRLCGAVCTRGTGNTSQDRPPRADIPARPVRHPGRTRPGKVVPLAACASLYGLTRP